MSEWILTGNVDTGWWLQSPDPDVRADLAEFYDHDTALLFVRAVNNQEALVSALREMLRLEFETEEEPIPTDELQRIIYAARAALKKTEEL